MGNKERLTEEEGDREMNCGEVIAEFLRDNGFDAVVVGGFPPPVLNYLDNRKIPTVLSKDTPFPTDPIPVVSLQTHTVVFSPSFEYRPNTNKRNAALEMARFIMFSLATKEKKVFIWKDTWEEYGRPGSYRLRVSAQFKPDDEL